MTLFDFLLLYLGSPADKLIIAAANGKLERVKRISEKGVDVNVKDVYGFTAVTAATRFGHIEVVRYLVNNGANVNMTSPPVADSPIQYAINDEDYEMTKLLVDNGANVNKRNKMGDTPLFTAAFKGCNRIGIYLVDNGAVINIKSHRLGITPLFRAVQNNHFEFTKMLIDRGADVNAECKIVGTPLICAARNNHELLVEYLINKGADVNYINERNKTTLARVMKFGNKEIVNLLEENGAK